MSISPKQKILTGAYRTKSKIPKTPKQKLMWKRSTAIAAKESGKYTDKTIPYSLVTTIYKNAVKADKVPKKEDIEKAKYSKHIASYKGDKEMRHAKHHEVKHEAHKRGRPAHHMKHMDASQDKKLISKMIKDHMDKHMKKHVKEHVEHHLEKHVGKHVKHHVAKHVRRHVKHK